MWRVACTEGLISAVQSTGPLPASVVCPKRWHIGAEFLRCSFSRSLQVRKNHIYVLYSLIWFPISNCCIFQTRRVEMSPAHKGSMFNNWLSNPGEGGGAGALCGKGIRRGNGQCRMGYRAPGMSGSIFSFLLNDLFCLSRWPSQFLRCHMHPLPQLPPPPLPMGLLHHRSHHLDTPGRHWIWAARFFGFAHPIPRLLQSLEPGIPPPQPLYPHDHTSLLHFYCKFYAHESDIEHVLCVSVFWVWDARRRPDLCMPVPYRCKQDIRTIQNSPFMTFAFQFLQPGSTKPVCSVSASQGQKHPSSPNLCVPASHNHNHVSTPTDILYLRFPPFNSNGQAVPSTHARYLPLTVKTPTPVWSLHPRLPPPQPTHQHQPTYTLYDSRSSIPIFRRYRVRALGICLTGSKTPSPARYLHPGLPPPQPTY